LVVRQATPEDLQAVGDLWELLIEQHRQLEPRFWESAPDGREKCLEFVTASLDADDRVLLVAEVEGRVVGFAHSMVADGPPPMRPRRIGHITDLVVHAGCRRRGIGRALVGGVRQWLAEKGADETRLSAAVANPDAVAFWRALGYEPITYGFWQPLC
jgi:ribosomal protein S18 acetylase RimI-like enzyme